jgi:hypothetical protein
LVFMSPFWLCRCLLDAISLVDRGGPVYLGADVVLTTQAHVSDLTFCRLSHVLCCRDTFQMYMSKLQIPCSHIATDRSNSSTHKYLLKEPSQGKKKEGIIHSHTSESSQRCSMTRPHHPKAFTFHTKQPAAMPCILQRRESHFDSTHLYSLLIPIFSTGRSPAAFLRSLGYDLSARIARRLGFVTARFTSSLPR